MNNSIFFGSCLKDSSIKSLLLRIRRIVEALIPFIDGLSPIKTKISIRAKGCFSKILSL